GQLHVDAEEGGDEQRGRGGGDRAADLARAPAHRLQAASRDGLGAPLLLLGRGWGPSAGVGVCRGHLHSVLGIGRAGGADGLRELSRRVASNARAGTATIAVIARYHVWPASVPSPRLWARPSTHASAVKRCSMRQRWAPILVRA